MVCNPAHRAVWVLLAPLTLAPPVLASEGPSEAHEPQPNVREAAPDELPARDVERDRWLRPVRAEPAYGRAALEILGVLSIGVAQYWMNADTNSQDWDFPHWSDRLGGSGVRFDNNTHVTNHILHPLAGASYYVLSRANGLGVGASALYTLGAAAAWEWGLEWREKISINDMFTTTLGGIAAGEFMNGLASYLNSAPSETNFARGIAKSTLGFPVWIHDQIDHRTPDDGPARDNLGFSSAYHHRFRVGYDNTWLAGSDDERQEIRGVALDARIVSLPGYLKPETFDTFFAQGNFSSGALEVHFDENGFREGQMRFDAILAGYYTQRASSAVLGAVLGFATGLEFMTKDTLDRGDQYAIIHCAGPELGASWKWSGYQLDVGVRASADFAAIRSLAWPEVYAAEPGATYKSSLERRYQYHFGISTRLAAELRIHVARLSAELGWGSYRSIQGFDRFQEAITRDLAGTEVLGNQRLGLAIEPPGTPLAFHAGLEGISHVSSLGGLASERVERRMVLGAGLAF